MGRAWRHRDEDRPVKQRRTQMPRTQTDGTNGESSIPLWWIGVPGLLTTESDLLVPDNKHTDAPRITLGLGGSVCAQIHPHLPLLCCISQHLDVWPMRTRRDGGGGEGKRARAVHLCQGPHPCWAPTPTELLDSETTPSHPIPALGIVGASSVANLSPVYFLALPPLCNQSLIKSLLSERPRAVPVSWQTWVKKESGKGNVVGRFMQNHYYCGK